MSVARVFERRAVTEGPIKTTLSVATCGKCGFTGSRKKTHVKGFADTGEQEFRITARKFERDGWHIGKRPQDDRCPACVKAVEDRKKHLSVVPQEEPVLKPATAATNGNREMTRDERRVIFAKLEDVYPSENKGYSAGWTDEKVAVDLGVPRVWVETVRKEFFGEVAANPEITALIAEAKEHLHEARPLLAKIEQTKAALGSLMAEAHKIAARAESIEKRLCAVEKAVRP